MKAIVKLKGVTPYQQGRYHGEQKKDKENHADYEERTWQEKAHYDKDTREIFIPPMAFANSLKEAAKFLSIQIPGKGKATYTKHFESGVLVSDNSYLGTTIDEVEKLSLHVPSDGQRGGTRRVLKHFPKIQAGWSVEVTYFIYDNTITEKVFEEVLECAGNLIGIGCFRPRNWGYFGRYEIENIKFI